MLPLRREDHTRKGCHSHSTDEETKATQGTGFVSTLCSGSGSRYESGAAFPWKPV